MGALAGAAVITFSITPLIIRMARHQLLLDWPSARKLHKAPIPALGGVAILLGLICGSLTYGIAFGFDQFFSFFQEQHHLALIVPCAIIFTVGLIDDVFGLSPAARILAETVAVSFLMMPATQGGYIIENIANPLGGEPIYLGLLAYPITLLWFIGITNAFNLIDGIDGLMSTVALSTALGCAGVAYVGGRQASMVLCLALGGSLIGFLPWNFHRARIFLGDAGSLLVGFTLAALALHVCRQPEADGAISMIPLVLLCAVPIMETLLTIARRHLSGQPYFSADIGHIHHVLLQKGFSTPKAVGILGFIQFFLSSITVVGFWQVAKFQWESTQILIPLFVIIICMGCFISWLGYLELKVAWDRIHRILFLTRNPHYEDAFALLRAGRIIRESADAQQIQNRLRVATQEGHLLLLAIELSPLGKTYLRTDSAPQEYNNPTAKSLLPTVQPQASWVFSCHALDKQGTEESTMVLITYRIPICGPRGFYGWLTTALTHKVDARPPSMQEVRRYLIFPMVATLESLPNIDSSSSPPPSTRS